MTKFKDKDLTRVQKASTWFGQALEMQFKENVLGPEPPPVGRIKNKYIINLLVKIPKNQSLEKTKKYIENVQRSFNSIKEFSSVRVNIDVDNY
jgi:primosomal protein N' (replication factor Y)